MKPMSRKIRLIYRLLLTAFFVLAVPLLILYSDGYRIGDELFLVKTGGMYIDSNKSGIELYLNDELVREATIFKRGFFVQNLKAGVYNMVVKKDGYTTWNKVVTVEEQKVSEMYSFVIPEEIEFEEIEEVDFFATTTSATSNILAYATTTSGVALSNIPVKERDGLVLWQYQNIIYSEWTKEEEIAPPYFCEVTCNLLRAIYGSPLPISYFDFYPDDNKLIVIVAGNNILVSEIDNRSVQNVKKIYEGDDVDMRVHNNHIYIRDGENYFRVRKF